MVRPFFDARIEQENRLASLRVNRSEIGSFESIAMVAGEREIFRSRLTTVLLGNNVVGFVQGNNIVFVDAAVFATTSCAIANQNAERGRDPLPAHAALRRCRRAWAFNCVAK